ncbi:MAG: gliding motility-associated ABC transporter substrate-binding protein GldG [Bacteroidetes bacterium]|nr:gliding motility-associated ABC transporter substrate-binding protein GldG [Bacteroidota bacterium]
MAQSKIKKGYWIIVLIILLFLNFMASLFHQRIDLTNEKRFTLTEPVKKLLNNIKEPVQVLVFLNGSLPSGFKKLENSTKDMLQEFKERSHGNIHFQFINANEKIGETNRSYADTLASLGIAPINLKVQLKEGEQSQYLYCAALVQSNNKWEVANLYTGPPAITPQELNTSESMLEYQFASALQRSMATHKPMVAYATGNGEPAGDNVYDLIENVLKKNYSLFTMNLQQEPVIPDTFKLMIVVKPTIGFSDQEKLKIDQYVMHGGKLLMFADRLEAEMDSLQLKNQVIAYDRNLQLEDLLFKFGVRINPDLVMDLQSDFLPFSVNGKEQFEFLHWNYFPLFESDQNNPINKNLGLVAAKFVNSIDTVASPGIQKTILLHSSANSRTLEAPALISGEENKNSPDNAAYNKRNIPVAVLLEGKFTSLYKNRIGRQQQDSLASYGSPFVAENVNENKMIIVSDGDIVLNATYKNQPLPMGVNPYTIGSQYEYQFANRQFVENCIEYLINEGGLMEAKSKNFTLRLLDTKKVSEQKTLWQVINLVVPVILLLLFGFIYQLVRKRKYTI